MKFVVKSMEAWIDYEINSSSRVRDILADRLEKDSETGKLVKKSLAFRHYLRIASPEHRRALTKMVLSGHSLAVERRRWTERGKQVVPQQWRLCRFCYRYIEDPAHAMFVCDNPELVPIRTAFLENVEKLIPGMMSFDVLRIFEASPMLLVTEPTLGS
jgi:hypothetical protein